MKISDDIREQILYIIIGSFFAVIIPVISVIENGIQGLNIIAALEADKDPVGLLIIIVIIAASWLMIILAIVNIVNIRRSKHE